jgi:hypothetical protein
MMGLCPHCICGARHIRQVASNQGAAYKGKGVMALRWFTIDALMRDA